MLKKVKDYIIENEMISPGDVILAGVSGGGDSMAMLGILRELREEMDFTLLAVHVHHGIRGKEADRDALLVENTCKEWGVQCITYRYDVPKLAKEWKEGHEETGRRVREDAFEKAGEEFRKREKRVRVAIAHNQEDLAETMLHNLARGTGLRGLSSMRPVSRERIRPILCLGRREIAYYLEENQIPHIVDSTNLSDEYTRNRIRHHILPALEKEINLRAAEHMAETAGRLAMAEDYLCEKGSELLARQRRTMGGYLLTEEFFHVDRIIRIYALQQAFEELAGRRKDFTAVHLEKVLELGEMRTGRQISLPYGLFAGKTYEGVFLRKRDAVAETADFSEKSWEIPVSGRIETPLGRVETKIFPYEGQKIEEKTYTKWLDYDRILYSLCIRTRREGDSFILNSKGDRKKLNRYMIDEKIPREMRDRIPLISSGDEILWMVGYRISEKYKIKSDTKYVLELKYQGGYEYERKNQCFTQ